MYPRTGFSSKPAIFIWAFAQATRLLMIVCWPLGRSSRRSSSLKSKRLGDTPGYILHQVVFAVGHQFQEWKHDGLKVRYGHVGPEFIESR